MILIIDNTQRKFRTDIRNMFLLKNIPCHITETGQCDEYMPVPLTIVTEQYLLDEVSYIAGVHHSNSPIYVYENLRGLYDFAVRAFSEQYGDIFGTTKISRVLTRSGEILFCGKPLYLTDSEQRILNMLKYAPTDPDTKEKPYYSREQIAAFCMTDGRSAAGAVAVHICNMNNKANRATGFDIVECKRYLGYRLHVF